ncbi:MAG: hypothetical protein QF890_15685 [Myxococcota bacterium]|nr:hypothetical protein [Deltaproteobacteria bacterium]MCP4241153.1 hypothetical protein [bacterium]MDP6075135.1 hypothetical protein [Myxococcota bacterium]MDP6242124.1 hypothetical protein [Myxococcota bacterium]MDP7074755.1 hypothetical protein [Myxococcota bacterium]
MTVLKLRLEWPSSDGRPTHRPRRHTPPCNNTAIPGDDDFVFHRLTGTGGPEAGPPADPLHDPDFIAALTER